MTQRKAKRSDEDFFIRNGAILLQKQISYSQGRGNAIRIFTYKELKNATNSYHCSNLVGCDGYGSMYKGVIDDRLIALKISHDHMIEELIEELVVLSNINHRNVVKVLGVCLETLVPILVFEFIPNGTLSQNMNARTQPLSWPTRIRIASEVADAINYLHCHSSTPIIHRNINFSSIMLDESYTAKLTNFELSFPIPPGKTDVMTQVLGTYGYAAPDYVESGRLSEKSDVFSFGVLLIGLLIGEELIQSWIKAYVSLTEQFDSHMKEGRLVEVVESRILREVKMEQLQEFAQVATRCVQLKPEERPTMKEVVQKLTEIRRLPSYSQSSSH